MQRKNYLGQALLILILFANFLMASSNNAFGASIVLKSSSEPRDRLRKYDDLGFSYETTTGFHCQPNGLVFFNGNSELKTIGGNQWEKDIAAGTVSALMNLLLAPFICYGLLSVFGVMLSSGASVGSTLMVFLMALGISGLSKLEELIYGKDDFSLDPMTPSCMPIAFGMLGLCVAIFIVLKLPINKLLQFAILAALSISLYTLKMVYSGVQYNRAKKVFGQVNLCGDKWLVYGMDGYTDQGLISENKIMENFPTRGSFFGSRKYALDKCFRDRELNFCQEVFADKNMLLEDLDARTSKIYKPYREFLYDGEEFIYEDGSCHDPRPERKVYLATANKTGQLYYFRGSDPANFACERFLEFSSREYQEAYHCCLNNSQRLICIQSPGNGAHVMCNKDDGAGNCRLSIEDYVPTGEVFEDNSDICGGLRTNMFAKSEDSNEKENCEDFEALKNTCGSSNNSSCCILYRNYDELCDSSGNFRGEHLKSSNGISGQYDASTGSDSGIVKFRIRPSMLVSNKYCVETYNFCPYNFRLLGGTERPNREFYPSYEGGYDVILNDAGEYEEKNPSETSAEESKKNNCTFDEDGNRHCRGLCFIDDLPTDCYNKPSNFCQIDRHCVSVPSLEEKSAADVSPYMDQACVDGIGSSHNFDDYINLNGGVPSRHTRVLTAPLVECVVETFKNILLNRAGHTRCANAKEVPDMLGNCNSGMLYQRRENLDQRVEYQNAFGKIRRYLRNLVRVIMALAVVLYGYNMILLHKGISPEEIMKFLLKLMIVGYFAFANGWITPLLGSIYRLYNAVTEFALRIVLVDPEGINYDNPKYSGCYFFKSNYINNHYENYGDRQYLAVFDTLDCKISRYFGYYTNNVEHPPILALFLMGVFSLGLGILMIMPFILIFAALLFFLLRVVFLFVANSLTITLLLFLTPLMVPLVLFAKTKKMFDNWLDGLVQNIMSPLFVFMALSIFFIIFDKYYTADARFFGTREPIRDVYCGELCKLPSGNFYYVSGSESQKSTQRATCNNAHGSVVNLMSHAPICATQGSGNSKSVGIGIINFFLEEAIALPGLAYQMSGFITMFTDLILLLLLIFIFEQFSSYVNQMAGAMFGHEGSFRGVDVGNLLPSLQNVMQSVAGMGAQLANTSGKPGSNAGRALVAKARNAYANRTTAVDGGKKNNNPDGAVSDGDKEKIESEDKGGK